LQEVFSVGDWCLKKTIWRLFWPHLENVYSKKMKTGSWSFREEKKGSRNHLVDGGIFVLVQKGNNAKKQVIPARNLKDGTKFTTQYNEKQKRKSSLVIATILCFPESLS